MLHLMKMKYVIPNMRMTHETAQSLYYLYYYTVIEAVHSLKILTERGGITAFGNARYKNIQTK